MGLHIIWKYLSFLNTFVIIFLSHKSNSSNDFLFPASYPTENDVPPTDDLDYRHHNYKEMRQVRCLQPTGILKVTGVNAEVQEHVKTRPAWSLNSSLWLFCGLVEKLLSCKSFHVYVCINRWWRWSTKNVPTSPEYTTSEKALKGWRCMQWRSQITLENTRQVVSKRARSINQTTLK